MRKLKKQNPQLNALLNSAHNMIASTQSGSIRGTQNSNKLAPSTLKPAAVTSNKSNATTEATKRRLSSSQQN